ncbi:MAG TPA: FGGY family carbohydrate kinase [Acidimicrobiales bacterium]|nr:FGGY family carbohydrate kinase [Acidimicrobiales bacterium]
MTPPSSLLLGLDVGSSRIKALLVDHEGREGQLSSVPSPFATTAQGVEAGVDELLGAVRRAVSGLGPDRERVAALSVAGLAESGAPLDGTGRPLAPVIAWHDRRGEDVAERLRRRFGPDLAHRMGQQVRYVSSAAKLGWLLDHGVTGVSRWLGVPELCLHQLTGATATEWSLAARTGCLDVGRRTWMPEVADAAGFDVDVFAEVLAAGTEMGRVQRAAADEWGLPSGVPVTIAGHDHLAGVVGSGADPADLVNSVGTAETVVGRSPTLPDVRAALEAGLAITLFPGGDGWAVLASGARAGLAVNEAAETLGADPAELDAEAAAGHDTLDAPGLLESLRRRDPPALPDGPAGVVWRTLLDALSVCTADAVERVTGLLPGAARLVVFGGGARSEPWLAAKTARLGVPVWRTAAGEAVARGAAVFGGVAAGWWSSPAEAPKPVLEKAQVAE